MSERANIQIGAIGGLLAAIVCCTAPLLVVALGSVGASAWFRNAYYVLIPALLICLGLIGLGLYRHRSAAQTCCNPSSLKQGR